MKNKKIAGITLIALVITIIVLLILAGVSIATLTGQNGILSKATSAKAETNEAAAREKVQLAAMSSFGQDGKFDSAIFQEEIERLGGNVVSADDEQIVVEVEGFEATIDADTGEILNFESAKGVRPEFNSKQQLSGTKVIITVEVTNAVGSVDSIKITNVNKGTELTGTVNGKIGTFETTLNGTYKIEVTATTDGVKKTATKTIEVNQIPVEFSTAYGRVEIVWLNTSDQIIGTPNQPNLGNMTPVKWDGTTESTTNKSDASWYNYKGKTGTEDNLESHWANAKNGESYFVWIPRYAYRIVYYANSSSDQITGYCDGDGIREVNGNVKQALSPTAKTVTSNGVKYIVHPAFRNGTSNNFKNGEWDKELSGIWVAKYEASHSDATASSAGSSATMKIVPGVQSWRSITTGNSYTKAYEYDREKESHMMKNSEWGAVAYLTQSQYGRNGHEIDINNSSSYITGNGGGSTNASSASGVTNAYNTDTGAKASTTGNIYGIYDLSGGAWERTAGYITNGNSNLSYGSSFVSKTEADGEGYKTLSTKYATVYPYNASSDSNTNNYTAYKNLGYGYGDAVLETSTSGSNNTSWHGDYSSFPNTTGPFFIRGGNYNNGAGAGVFSFGNTGGIEYSYDSFRPVLAF